MSTEFDLSCMECCENIHNGGDCCPDGNIPSSIPARITLAYDDFSSSGALDFTTNYVSGVWGGSVSCGDKDIILIHGPYSSYHDGSCWIFDIICDSSEMAFCTRGVTCDPEIFHGGGNISFADGTGFDNFVNNLPYECCSFDPPKTILSITFAIDIAGF